MTQSEQITFRSPEFRETIKAMDKIVKFETGVTPEQLREKHTRGFVTDVRHSCMFILYYNTEYSMELIGLAYNRAGHSATSHAIAKVLKHQTNRKFHRKIEHEFLEYMETGNVRKKGKNFFTRCLDKIFH